VLPLVYCTHSNNNTVGSRLIRNMSQTSRGAIITQYLVFEGLDAVGQTTLLVDAEISSLAKPADGVGLRVRCRR
jgi:hypothetical protein